MRELARASSEWLLGPSSPQAARLVASGGSLSSFWLVVALRGFGRPSTGLLVHCRFGGSRELLSSLVVSRVVPRYVFLADGIAPLWEAVRFDSLVAGSGRNG